MQKKAVALMLIITALFLQGVLAGDTVNFGSELKIIEIDIVPSPSSWTTTGETGSSTSTAANYFTLYNNGNGACIVKIAVNNSANWIYTDWTTYSSSENLNYFTANFTLDGITWTNIATKDANGNPQTILIDNLPAGGNVTFGIKIWVPKLLSTIQDQQFEIYLKAEAIL